MAMPWELPQIVSNLVLEKEALQSMMQQNVNDLQKSMILVSMRTLIEAEIAGLCGDARKRSEQRAYVRFGKQSAGHLSILDQKIPYPKPRVRTKDKKSEAVLETYNKFQGGMSEDAFKKMLFGISTRNYELAIHAMQDGYGISKSSVSRRYVKESAAALEALCTRKIDRYFPIVYLDGLSVGGEMMLIALGVDIEGHKAVLGMHQGTTEHSAVVKGLFDDLEKRGFSRENPTLFVIDGSQAIAKAIKERFAYHLIQRCQEHKKRNILAYFKNHPMHNDIKMRLHTAYAETDFEKGKELLLSLSKYVGTINSDAAASVREGLEETLTIRKLGVAPLLARTLRTTNPIESLNSMLETFSARVKRWQGGSMRKRWLAVAAIESERRMNRVHGNISIVEMVEKMCRELNYDMSKVLHGRAA